MKDGEEAEELTGEKVMHGCISWEAKRKPELTENEKWHREIRAK